MDLPGSAIIDDSDPRVQYSTGWRKGGVDQEYNGTTSTTSTADATFTFVFSGTSVSVVGTLDRGFPNSTYTLDGSSPSYYRGVFTGTVEYQQTFYRSPLLPNGQHTLVGACEHEGGRIIVDYFVVGTSVSDSNASTTRSGSSTDPTQTDTVNPSSTSESPIGAIVGGVVGGLGTIILVLVSLWWISRRHRTSDGRPPEDILDTAGTDHAITRPPPANRGFDAGSDVIYITLPERSMPNSSGLASHSSQEPEMTYSPYSENPTIASPSLQAGSSSAHRQSHAPSPAVFTDVKSPVHLSATPPSEGAGSLDPHAPPYDGQ